MRVAFINPQGNFDSRDSYWTRHPDFGGQLVYVKELAIALSKLGVNCDILTRKILDERWPQFADESDFYSGIEKVRIIRVPFGPDRFLRKEDLWPWLNEFKKGIEEFYHNDRTLPNFFTAHYGDGGIVGAMLFKNTGIPYSFTAHSLGAQKLDKLLATGQSREELERKFNFSFRIAAERIAMEYSAVNFVSTAMERYQQYGHRLYRDYSSVEDDSKFRIVPPGVNSDIFNPQSRELDVLVKERLDRSLEKYINPLRHDLPFIVLSSRLEPKKNHAGILEAFANDPQLNQSSNLLITVNGLENPYEDLEKLSGAEKAVLRELVESIIARSIQDKVLFLNVINQRELAALYRMVALKRSIFALASLYEPFGLAPLEAMACGLPVVVTSNGGPSESLRENGTEYGVLIDPLEEQDIARGLKKLILGGQEIWNRFSERARERVLSKYTWDATAKGYIETIKEKMSGSFREPKIPDYIYTARDIPFIE